MSTPACAEGAIFLSTGLRLRSTSGRVLNPAPRIDCSTDRRARATLARVDAWLAQEARAEAQTTGQTFLRTLLRDVGVRYRMSAADRDTANEVLFGYSDGPRSSHLVSPEVPPGP